VPRSSSVAILRVVVRLASIAGASALAACSSDATPAETTDAGNDPDVTVPSDITPDQAPDAAPGESPDAAASLTIGQTARVIAASLNLRSGAGTSNAILLAMPCGTQVAVVGGPTSGWWNVKDGATTGWASGSFLVPDARFDPAVCGGGSTDGGSAASDGSAGGASVADIFARAKLGVGYSY
jgi:hypothetical protein